jgi:protein involved in polysaccharide export with SLBB domain
LPPRAPDQPPQPPPVNFPETGNLSPSIGYPIPVREDGTVVLPSVEPIRVQGLTIREAQERIRRAYTVEKAILKTGRERVIVTLLRRRLYQILVIREDAPGTPAAAPSTAGSTRAIGFTIGAAATPGGTRRGTGQAVDLPAYENDVLHALTLTGGLPGTDAVNEVVIERASFKGDRERAALLDGLGALPPGCDPRSALGRHGPILRIPLRLRPGEVPPIRPEDVVLRTGDIVYIQARQAEFFYTAGLLPAGEYVLPRDYDLDVVKAITRVGGPLVTGGINTLNISGSLYPTPFGFPSPSLLTVVRQTPDGGQVPIRVDLNRALRDPRERLLVQAGDVLILQETPGQAFARWFSQEFNFTIIANVIHTRDVTGTIFGRAP